MNNQELESLEIQESDRMDDIISISSTSSVSSSTSSSSSSCSCSGSCKSDSDAGSASSDEDEPIKTKIFLANKTELNLPKDICEEKKVFKELFSAETFRCLSDEQKQYLKNFLPSFPENDLMEKNNSLGMLFSGQPIRFGINPLDDFHEKLRNGNFEPGVAKMKSILRRTLKRQFKKNQRAHRLSTLKKLITGRKKVLDDLIVEEKRKREERKKKKKKGLNDEELQQANEGQAAAAMLLGEMGYVEEDLILPEPPLIPPTPRKSILDSKITPSKYDVKQDFDSSTNMINFTVTECPPSLSNPSTNPAIPKDSSSKKHSSSRLSTRSEMKIANYRDSFEIKHLVRPAVMYDTDDSSDSNHEEEPPRKPYENQHRNLPTLQNVLPRSSKSSDGINSPKIAMPIWDPLKSTHKRKRDKNKEEKVISDRSQAKRSKLKEQTEPIETQKAKGQAAESTYDVKKLFDPSTNMINFIITECPP